MNSDIPKRPVPLERDSDIEAEIRFLSTSEGGRQTPVATGYRPNHDLGMEGMLNDAVHEYVGVDWVAPGDTVHAKLWFFAPEFQVGRLHEGMEFTVQEGARVVGRGKVTKIFNDELRKRPVK